MSSRGLWATYTNCCFRTFFFVSRICFESVRIRFWWIYSDQPRQMLNALNGFITYNTWCETWPVYPIRVVTEEFSKMFDTRDSTSAVCILRTNNIFWQLRIVYIVSSLFWGHDRQLFLQDNASRCNQYDFHPQIRSGENRFFCRFFHSTDVRRCLDFLFVFPPPTPLHAPALVSFGTIKNVIWFCAVLFARQKANLFWGRAAFEHSKYGVLLQNLDSLFDFSQVRVHLLFVPGTFGTLSGQVT